MRRYQVGMFVLGAVALAGACGYLGYRAGQADTFYMMSAEITDSHQRRAAVIDHMLGKDDFRGLYGQDLWVSRHLYPGVSNGYFVDLGAADGEIESNTKLLELVGWKGICIDPFASSMDKRTCTVVREVVDAEAGNKVEFQQPGSFSGGILKYAGSWISEEEKKQTVTLTTTTLETILDRAGAPHFINYMNVDIEGAEYVALKVFPFDKYRIGALTIEHNNLEDRRMEMRHLMEANGYRLERAILDQDWYVLDDLETAQKQ
jgi:methyltransferase FkbM-like protein